MPQAAQAGQLGVCFLPESLPIVPGMRLRPAGGPGAVLGSTGPTVSGSLLAKSRNP